MHSLEFAYLTIGELPAEVTITPLDKHETVEPLNTSLQTLSLRFDCSGKACDTVAQYLLMRLPNLVVFSAPDVSTETVLNFAREYSRFYPHLNNAESVFRDQRQQ
ncbi:hypothetical protein H4R21_001899 [Coemansia helicoidea]|uniref:Uncharacterized protein n=1 Tax=Coemansia helicoidea TaxID=1286919 RepID=A0ACC1L9Z3_9FUNG|nr:hypothetical protein H4R21_001899 [Coemansia helicoidea]